MITRCDSVEEAVAYAEKLKAQFPNMVFRGQKENWPIISSFVRQSEESKELSLQKMGRFDHWISITPGLEELAKNTDAKIAVAQHYGLATNFIDFSTEPKVAGFFATEDNEPYTKDQEACIVCLDPDDLVRLWSEIMKDQISPELLRIEVNNLWRMQGQYGQFLYCPYAELDTRFYHMDRILFPRTHQFKGIQREMIYPSRKSHLETLLDQFFMNERMIEFEATADFSNLNMVNMTMEWEDSDPNVYPNGIPRHSSWSEVDERPWLSPTSEVFSSVITEETIVVVIDSIEPRLVLERVFDQLAKQIENISGARVGLLNWSVLLDESVELEAGFPDHLVAKINRFWDGVRSLPYSDVDIIMGLANLIAFGVALRGDLKNTSGHHWEAGAREVVGDTLLVEFGADDGSYSRCHVSASKIEDAIRFDIRSYVSPEYQVDGIDQPVNVLRMARVPQQIFDAARLNSMFVTDIVPIQVLMREAAIFYSPARLTKFGLA